MKIYLKTWSQFFTHTHFLFANRIELQLIAAAILTDMGAYYVGLNADLNTRGIIESDMRNNVSEMRRKRAIYPRHKVAQMWNTIYQHCESVPRDQPIEIVGFGMESDKRLFQHLLRQRIVIPPDFFIKRISYRDMRDDVRELAHAMPDDVFADLESPFGLMIDKQGTAYTLSQKITMLKSHVDFPQLNTNSLLAEIKGLEKMDNLLTSLKEQYAY